MRAFAVRSSFVARGLVIATVLVHRTAPQSCEVTEPKIQLTGKQYNSTVRGGGGIGWNRLLGFKVNVLATA
ncbi:hypothetical protein LRC484719_23910 [Mycobacterium riyadhense]